MVEQAPLLLGRPVEEERAGVDGRPQDRLLSIRRDHRLRTEDEAGGPADLEAADLADGFEEGGGDAALVEGERADGGGLEDGKGDQRDRPPLPGSEHVGQGEARDQDQHGEHRHHVADVADGARQQE